VIDLRSLGTSRPIVTITFIVLNVVGYLAQIATGGSITGGGGRVFTDGALIGTFCTRSIGGVCLPDSALGVAHGEWWRVVTGGFLHASLIHLGMNMLVLWLLGSQLEPLLGRARFAALYIACLVGGAFGVLLVSPTSPTIGASGAVFGLMGAAVMAQRRAGIDVWRNGIGGLVLVNLLFTFAVPNISIGGHIGGLVAGVAIGALVFALDRAVRSPWAGVAACGVITVVLWMGCVVVAAR